MLKIHAPNIIIVLVKPFCNLVLWQNSINGIFMGIINLKPDGGRINVVYRILKQLLILMNDST